MPSEVALPLGPPFVHTVDSVGLKTANISATVAFYKSVLGFDQKFLSNVYFGNDPALIACPGNNSGIQLRPSSTRGLSHVSFRVSERGYDHAKKMLRERQIKFTEQSRDVCKNLVFQDPVNGYELMLTWWPVSKSRHATKHIRRRKFYRYMGASFSVGVCVGISMSVISAFIIYRYKS